MVHVRDKVLLSKLATVLQQMDSSIFSSPEAVQEVSVILNICGFEDEQCGPCAVANAHQSPQALHRRRDGASDADTLSPLTHFRLSRIASAPDHTGKIQTDSTEVVGLITRFY